MEVHSTHGRIDVLDASIALTGWEDRAVAYLRREHGATLLQFWVLLILRRRGALGICDMQRLLELNYTTVAECVGSLERAGFLVKREDPEDARRLSVELTPAGSERFIELDAGLLRFSSAVWEEHPEPRRKMALFALYRACEQLGKVRLVGNLARGDTAYLAFCAQFAMQFQWACDEVSIPAGQAVALMLLGRSPEGVRVGEIAAVLGRKPCDVSKMLSQMERRGLVSKRRGECLRERMVRATDLGMERCAQVESAAASILDQHFGDVEDVAPLAEALSQLADQYRKDAL